MREIKFRTWDIKGKYFRELDMDVYMFLDGELYWDGNPTDRFELSQFTGLKDKNGKDIYEGDIVKTNEGDWIAKVVYSLDGFCCKDNEGGFSGYCQWDKFEVIGNIYENPDLLKD